MSALSPTGMLLCYNPQMFVYLWNAFWSWYERTYTLNISIAFGLFLLQILHLIWLSGEVVTAYVYGTPAFVLEGLWKNVIVLVDYTEIPALVSVSLIYISQLRHQFDKTALLYLVFLNSQWLHIFWITDEFVVTSFNQQGTILPIWLAWLAVGIDYLELPVMWDTGKKVFIAIKDRRSEEEPKLSFEE